MKFITTDGSLKADLSEVKEIVEVKNPAGEVIGLYAPTSMPDWKDYLHIITGLDPEEVKRRDPSKEKCYTSDEVTEHLRSLEAKGRDSR